MEDIKEKQKSTYKPKDSKVSNQTHIKEETTATGEMHYHCTACRKSFRSRSQKYYHLSCNQLQDMIFKCDHCDKCFARHSQWKYHVESHTSPINECSKCQKIFSNPLALKKHEALHKVEPKPCPRCEKTFQKKISLDQHIAAQHLNQLQFGCAYCNKKYASKSTLHLHLQSHEKKRFECTICGKLFQRNSILNLHLKRHYQTNNYNCPDCHKVFSESGALSRHRKIHEENVLQYHCKLCNKNILRKDNMTRHLNTIHPYEKFEDIVDILRSSPEKIDKMDKGKADQTKATQTGSDAEIINNRETNNDNTDKQIQINIATSNEKCVILENKIIQNPIKVPYSVVNETPQVPDQLMVTNGHVLSSDIPKNISITDQQIINPMQVISDVPQNNEKRQIPTNIQNVSQELLQYEITEPDLQYTILKNCKEDLKENTSYTYLSDVKNYNQAQDTLDRHIDFLGMPTDTLKSYPERSQHQTNSFKTPQIQHYVLFNDNRNTNDIDNCLKFSKTTQSKTISDVSQLLYPVPKEQEEYRNKAQSSSEQINIHVTPVTQTISSVIKSIGNVKKNLTPTLIQETNTTSNAVTTIKPTLYSLNLEYKHKKYSRNNYDIDLYRKILGCDDEDDDNNYFENDDQEGVDQQQSSIRSSNHTTNAVSTPVHWRKSFKNNYETFAS